VTGTQTDRDRPAGTPPAARRMPTWLLVTAGLVVALLLAGVVSFYASSSPDGLNKVAEDHGFAGTAGEHAAADSPFANYSTRGVDNDRLAGGLAGVAGAVVVLALAGGLAFVVRRKSR